MNESSLGDATVVRPDRSCLIEGLLGRAGCEGQLDTSIFYTEHTSTHPIRLCLCFSFRLTAFAFFVSFCPPLFFSLYPFSVSCSVSKQVLKKPLKPFISPVLIFYFKSTVLIVLFCFFSSLEN